MRIGFGKQDITPRLGVELCGYSVYLNRYATAVRDRLWARSLAVGDGRQTAVVVSCDLLGVTAEVTAEVRRRVREATGLDEACVMVHATHTHSGPCVGGTGDPPYQALLPRRIAQACVAAVRSLQEAELLHAVVPCEGLGTNRVYDRFDYGEAALADDFRPALPERTDTRCHVLKAVSGGRLLGFASYFGCHNVVGGPACTYVHGDFAGIATGMIERENPGAVGLFLQGAEGDVNSAICCLGNDKVLGALDVMASRYARAVRHGLEAAGPVDVAAGVRVARRQVRFSRRQVPLDEVRRRLAAEEAILDRPEASDADEASRWATLHSLALQDIIARMERGDSFEDMTELHGVRIGPVALLGSPHEIFQAVKNDVVAQARAPVPLVLGLTNEPGGYAVDRTTAGNATDYAANTVPLWHRTLPFRDIHGEEMQALLEIDRALND